MNSEMVLKALADTTRQRTLAVLQRHELSVSELVKVLDQPQSTVSRHLKVLRDAGLLRDRRNGNTVMYSLMPTANNGELEDGSDAQSLTKRLMDWIAQQPLNGIYENRLGLVIRRRGEMSRRFFDRIGQQWDTMRTESFGPSFHLEAFLSLLPDHWTVADLGAGTGYLLPVLSKRFRKVVAIEPTDAMRGAAQERVRDLNLHNVTLLSGDLTALPIDEAEVDLAIAVLVLHHVPVPQDALTEMMRILKPGGRLLIVEQAAHTHESFRERMQDRWWGFEKQAILDMVSQSGFTNVRLHELTTVQRAGDAPELFALTGVKGEEADN